ncbi:MAG: hypothetical protein ABIA04_11460 [Pseudomonadota bacterium]
MIKDKLILSFFSFKKIAKKPCIVNTKDIILSKYAIVKSIELKVEKQKKDGLVLDKTNFALNIKNRTLELSKLNIELNKNKLSQFVNEHFKTLYNFSFANLDFDLRRLFFNAIDFNDKNKDPFALMFKGYIKPKSKDHLILLIDDNYILGQSDHFVYDILANIFKSFGNENVAFEGVKKICLNINRIFANEIKKEFDFHDINIPDTLLLETTCDGNLINIFSKQESKEEKEITETGQTDLFLISPYIKGENLIRDSELKKAIDYFAEARKKHKEDEFIIKILADLFSYLKDDESIETLLKETSNENEKTRFTLVCKLNKLIKENNFSKLDRLISDYEPILAKDTFYFLNLFSQILNYDKNKTINAKNLTKIISKLKINKRLFNILNTLFEDNENRMAIIDFYKGLTKHTNEKEQIEIYKEIAAHYDKTLERELTKDNENTENTIKLDPIKTAVNGKAIEFVQYLSDMGLESLCNRASVKSYIYFELAKAEITKNENKKALSLMTNALKCDPSNYILYRNIRLCAIKNNNFDLVKELFNKEKDFIKTPEQASLLQEESNYFFETIKNNQDPTQTGITEIDYDNSVVKQKIAENYIKSEQKLKAIKGFEEVLSLNPFKEKVYENLATLYLDLNFIDHAYCSYSALMALDPEHQEAWKYITEYRAKYHKILPKNITQDLRITHLTHKQFPASILIILQTIYPIVYRIHRTEITKSFGGIKKEDSSVTKKYEKIFTKICSFLESPKIRLYIVSGKLARTFEIEGYKNPTLIIDKNKINKMSPACLRFALAKAVEHIVNYNAVYLYLDAKKIEKIIDTIGYTVLPEYQEFVSGDVLSSEIQSKVDRILSKAQRETLRNYFIEYASIKNDYPIEQIVSSFIHTSNRSGLLASNDLLESVEYIVQSDPNFDPIEFNANRLVYLSKSDRVAQLLRFNMSEEFFSLRRILGIALK